LTKPCIGAWPVDGETQEPRLTIRFGNAAVVGESYGLHSEPYALTLAKSVPFGTDASLT